MAIPSIVAVAEKEFILVKRRAYTAISVYRQGNMYARIGPKRLIQKETHHHQKLRELGFPISRIIRQGRKENFYYYLESSLGNKHFGDRFREDCTKTGRIANKSFFEFMGATKKFIKAQIHSAHEPEGNFKDFAKGIHLDYIGQELPDLQVNIQRAFQKVKERLNEMPFVPTHGDLNPHNIFPKGIIDLENFFQGPLGYDIITNIFHIYFFPIRGEYHRGYSFTPKQIQKYLDIFDQMCRVHSLPEPSHYLNEFILCRSIWSTVRMHKYPTIQQWRYNRFRKLLITYLNGQELRHTILK